MISPNSMAAKHKFSKLIGTLAPMEPTMEPMGPTIEPMGPIRLMLLCVDSQTCHSVE